MRSPEVPGDLDLPMFDEFTPRSIDTRWQSVWDSEHSWEVSNEAADRRRAYVLEMLPYTSGEPHVGHLKNYSVGDAVAHFLRRQGYYVLHPMGYDAFGLPAENHAIRTGKHPRVSTDESIAAFREQFRQWGISIDWTREISSHTPEYYRWTQWIFLQLYEAGLTYRKNAAVNWCPTDATVLANEQVIAGRCERCGARVEMRHLEQWFFKITKYADQLLSDLDSLGWPEHVKMMQRNWIGRSEGAHIDFRTEAGFLRVFTTRPDTVFGATYMVLAPEHPLVDSLTAESWPEGTDLRWTGGHESPKQGVNTYRLQASMKSELERQAETRDKAGVFVGSYAINPANRQQVPIFVADYVLAGYGTGAIMAVPGQDERDWEFAEAFNIPIVRTVQPPADWAGKAYTGDGRAINSANPDAGISLDGLDVADAKRAIIDWLAKTDHGGGAITYKLRDWLLSRQRYWGCPIPIVYCGSCGPVSVPEDQLPVELPDITDYTPKGRSPLAAAEEWVSTSCPRCGKPARRETDTMDTFVDSSWYYLRYCDPRNDNAAWSPEAIDSWLPVDQYIGGVEHAILHLLYARFFVKALADLGYLSVQEPFAKLFTQGMITKDGTKMSKSKGNVISPRTIIDEYGADTARCYTLFMGPPEQGGDWSDQGVEGVYRFLKRVWRLSAEVKSATGATIGSEPTAERDATLRRACAVATQQVTDDMSGRFAFNTAIAALMKLSNECSKAFQDGVGTSVAKDALATLSSLLLPFAPHVASEVYYQLTGDRVWKAPWPVVDEDLLRTDTIEIVCQVNAKVRGKLIVPATASEGEIRAAALASEQVRRHLAGRRPQRVIVVPGRLVNVVG